MDVECRVPARVMEGKEGRRETAYNPSDVDDGAADKERDNSSTMAVLQLLLYPRHGLAGYPSISQGLALIIDVDRRKYEYSYYAWQTDCACWKISLGDYTQIISVYKCAFHRIRLPTHFTR